MGGGRTPCCDKSKVKTGPWSTAEDARLVAFIHDHGHSNWRTLPKQAGLLRCGKSCRLRWINYLRPHVKRGNFTPQEEETIIELHNSLGNKWSKIALHLPGRTDNDIKNVWNTHLKKRAMASKKEHDSTSSSTSCDSRTVDESVNMEPIQGTGVGDGEKLKFIKAETTHGQSEDIALSCSTSSSIEPDPRSEVSISVSEIGKIEIEANLDEDIWTMLDSMDTGSSSLDVGKDDELKRWMAFFECDLFLEGDGDQWLRDDKISKPLDYFALWSSSPVFLDS